MANKVIIIPYFGQFNNFFDLFISSVSYNHTTDWLLVTDAEINIQLPENVHLVTMKFSDFRNLVQSKFDFKISLDRPYKLADFRPAYGYILEDYIQNYNFWGYGDTDVIMGNVDEFITSEMLSNFDKIGFLGHFTLIRNSRETNLAFKLNASERSVEPYKTVFTSDMNHSFDELFSNSINSIFLYNGFKTLFVEHEYNTYMKTSNFYRTYYDFDNHQFVNDKKKGYLAFDKGTLKHVSKASGAGLDVKKYMYVHFQSRNMTVRTEKNDRFKIIPNSFDELSESYMNYDNFSHEKLKHFNLHYFKLRSKNLYVKLRKRLLK